MHFYVKNLEFVQDMDDEMTRVHLRPDDEEMMMELLLSSSPDENEGDAGAMEQQVAEEPAQKEPAENPPGPARSAEQPPQQEPAENLPGPARPAEQPPQQEEHAEFPPRAAKRVRFADMTPRSKEKEKQRRIAQHRASSNKWHTKWVSKGVPKECTEAGNADGAAGSAGSAEAAGRAEPERPAQELPEILITAELWKEASLEQQHLF